jgi:hypothetical protein
MKKPAISVEIPEYLQTVVNKAVRYYLDGWRVGYLDGFTKAGLAIIQPVSAIGGKKPHTVHVELSNIETIEPTLREQESFRVEAEHRGAEVVYDEPKSDVKKTKRGCRL